MRPTSCFGNDPDNIDCGCFARCKYGPTSSQATSPQQIRDDQTRIAMAIRDELFDEESGRPRGDHLKQKE